MSEIQFSDAEIASMADAVSDQLNALTVEMTVSGDMKALRADGTSGPPLVPERLRGPVESATGESAESFYEKIRRLFQQDLCREGGHLNGEWKKYKDLPTKDVVQWTITALAVLGVTVGSAVVVTVSVWLLHVVLNIGIQAICEDVAPQGNS